MPAVPGHAPPPGSGRAALTQADGSERPQRALTKLRGCCLLHGGSLSPALQRGGNRGGSAPTKPLRRAAGAGGASGPRCPRPPGGREWRGRPPQRRPHVRPTLPLRGRWQRTDGSAAAAAPRDRPAERLRRPGQRARGAQRSAAPLCSAPLRAHLRGRRQRAGGTGGLRPGAEGKARAERARAAPAAGLPVRHRSPRFRGAPAPVAMAQPALAPGGPGRAQRQRSAPRGPPLCRTGAGSCGPMPGGRAQCRRRWPPLPGAVSAQRVTRMPFPSRIPSGATLRTPGGNGGAGSGYWSWLRCSSRE